VDCRADIAGSVRRKPAATVSSNAQSHLITDPEKFDLTIDAYRGNPRMSALRGKADLALGTALMADITPA